MNLTFAPVYRGNPELQFTSIAFGNNTIVAAGNSAVGSTNGVDWQLLPMSGGSVIYAANRFVMVNGSFWSSPDGFNWKNSVADDPAYSVTYDRGVFVANGRSSIYYSFDGENWTKLQQHGSYNLAGVYSGNGLFATYGTYTLFPSETGAVFGTSTNGTNWTIGTYGPGSVVPYMFASTFAWGNFYNTKETSSDLLNIIPYFPFSVCRSIKFAGNRLVGFGSNSPNILISASEGFDLSNRPIKRYQYTTGVTNYLNDVAFDGAEYYFVGAGEIILKSQGVPAPAWLTFNKIEDQTLTLTANGVPGMTYGLQAIGNAFVGVSPSLATDSIFDFTLNGPSTNVSVSLLFTGASMFRLVER